MRQLNTEEEMNLPSGREKREIFGTLSKKEKNLTVVCEIRKT